MLRKDCTTVKDRASSEIFHTTIATAKVPILLRFVSKRAKDFNEISTDSSPPKITISPLKIDRKPFLLWYQRHGTLVLLFLIGPAR